MLESPVWSWRRPDLLRFLARIGEYARTPQSTVRVQEAEPPVLSLPRQTLPRRALRLDWGPIHAPLRTRESGLTQSQHPQTTAGVSGAWQTASMRYPSGSRTNAAK